MVVMKRLFTLLSALVMVASAVSAQEPSGMFEPVRPGFDFDRTLHAAPDAGLMCDSLKFRLNMDDSLWLRSYVKDYRLPESAAPQALGIDRLGTIVPAGSGMPVYGNPYASDYKVGGVVAAWNGGVLFGSGSLTSMPALMSMQSATLGAVQNAGNFTFTASVSADRAAVWRTAGAYPAAAGGMSTLTGGTYYTFAGSMTYRFSDNVSATVFGRYSTNRSFYSMASMPYLGTSGYGGYLTFMGETVGMDVGVERYYDTFARRWVTSPIITPKVRFSDKFTLAVPVGPLVRDLLEDAIYGKKQRGGPIIMPEGLPSVGEVPFGPPEMPH